MYGIRVASAQASASWHRFNKIATDEVEKQSIAGSIKRRAARASLAAVGESSLSALHSRPDYAITLRKVLVGYVEVKAPGKGADPRRFKGHDKEQWEKLQSLPNLLYTDGNSFSLWQNGELVGSIVELDGNIETSGAKLSAPPELLARFDNFLRWEPIPPKFAADLTNVAARLCRLLREEVTL